MATHHTICRFGQALRFETLATPSATLRVTLKSLRYVPSLHSKRLGAGLRPSPTLFVGYRTEKSRFGQALRYEPLATPSATLRVTPKSLRYVPSLHSKRLGAGFQPSPTLFVGYRFEFGIPSYI